MARVQADAAPDRRAGAAAAGPVEQADRARAQSLGRDREGPRGRRAAGPGREFAHPGRARRQPDAGPGWHRTMAASSFGLNAPAGPTAATGGRPASARRGAARHLRAAARPGPRHLRLQSHVAGRPPGRRRPDRPDPRRRRAAAAAVGLGRPVRGGLAAPAVAGPALCPARAEHREAPAGAAAHLAGRRARRRLALGRGRLAVLSLRQRAAADRPGARRLHLQRRQRADPGAAVPAVRGLRDAGVRAGDRRGRGPARRRQLAARHR